MDTNPLMNNQNIDPNAMENAMISTAETEEEAARKALSYKRMTMLLVILALVVLAFIIWEVVDIAMGGRP